MKTEIFPTLVNDIRRGIRTGRVMEAIGRRDGDDAQDKFVVDLIMNDDVPEISLGSAIVRDAATIVGRALEKKSPMKIKESSSDKVATEQVPTNSILFVLRLYLFPLSSESTILSSYIY